MFKIQLRAFRRFYIAHISEDLHLSLATSSVRNNKQRKEQALSRMVTGGSGISSDRKEEGGGAHGWRRGAPFGAEKPISLLPTPTVGAPIPTSWGGDDISEGRRNNFRGR